MGQKSFTLIEVLLVITIIAILSAIVLVAMPLSKKKSQDAAITSDLLKIQNKASRIYLDTGNYDSVCCVDPPPAVPPDPPAVPCDTEIKSLCADITAAKGEAPTVQRYDNGPPYFGYCIWSFLVSNTSSNFCIDHRGYSGGNRTMNPCHHGYQMPACNLD